MPLSLLLPAAPLAAKVWNVCLKATITSRSPTNDTHNLIHFFILDLLTL